MNDKEYKAEIIFMTWLVNLNHIIQLKLSGSLNNIKSGINN